MTSTQIVTPIGGVINLSTGDTIPIYSLEDSLEITRSQSWDVQALNVQGGMVAQWNGPDPIRFQLHFKLTVGWGKVPTRASLYQMCRAFHAMGAHRNPSQPGGICKSPPACLVQIGDYIESAGFFQEVTVVAEPPWGGTSNTAASSSLSAAYPTSAIFRGTFYIMPGYTQGTNGDFVVSVDLNNTQTTMEAVRMNFYRFSTNGGLAGALVPGAGNIPASMPLTGGDINTPGFNTLSPSVPPMSGPFV